MLAAAPGDSGVVSDAGSGISFGGHLKPNQPPALAEPAQPAILFIASFNPGFTPTPVPSLDPNYDVYDFGGPIVTPPGQPVPGIPGIPAPAFTTTNPFTPGS